MALACLLLAAIATWATLGGTLAGPFTADPALRVEVLVVAWFVAAASVCCLLVLGRLGYAWHADGWYVAGVLTCLGGYLVLAWQQAPTAVRSLGGVLAPLLVVALLAPIARRSRSGRQLTRWTAAVLAATSFAVFVVRDPFQDPDCWADCSIQGAVWPSPALATVLVATLSGLVVAAAGVGVALAVAVAAREPRPERLDLAVVVTAGLAATGMAAATLAPDRTAPLVPGRLALIALGGFAIAVGLQPVATLRRRHRLRLLMTELDEVPPLGALERTLARVLDDPGVRVAYWLTAQQRYVTADGHRVPDAASWPLTLRRDDQLLAAVWVTRTDRDPSEVESAIGSAARLAVDNERLQAEIRAQLAEVSASRRRIVAAADDTRRRVERSIHDVVQAELLGSLYELALARSRAERAGDAGTAEELREISDGVRSMVGVVRDFARGLYPVALDASGLGAALGAFADDATVALSVEDRSDVRPPAEVERAVFLLVHDAVGRAKGPVSVRLARQEQLLTVAITGYPGLVPGNLVDCIGAVDGRLQLSGESRLTVVLPCGR